MIDKLRIRLMASFLLITVVPLLLVGGFTGFRSKANLEKQSIALQREVVERVGLEFTSFIDQRLIELQVLEDLLGLDSLGLEAQRTALDSLLIQNQYYQELSLLGPSGQELMRRSRTQVILNEQLTSRRSEAVFTVPAENQQIFYGSIQFDSNLREPLLEIASPIVANRTGETHFVVVAAVRVKAIWEILATMRIPESIDVYILNSDDQVVAHKNPSTVLQNIRISSYNANHRSRRPDGTEVIIVQGSVTLGQQTLQVLTMQPIANAFSLATENAWIALGITVAAIFGAVALGALLTHQLVKPIENLARYAGMLGQGNFPLRFAPGGRGEVRELGVAFQEMATRLKSIVSDLEQDRYGATELAQVTLESIGDAVITTNAHGLVNYLNPVARKLTGWSLADACGLPLSKIFPGDGDIHGGHQADSATLYRPMHKDTVTSNTSVLVNKEGRKYTVQYSNSIIRKRNGTSLGSVLVFIDVTEARRKHDELSYHASHDALTGLVNRREREFENRLQHMLTVARDEHSVHVICYLDLDYFKRVNDTCGHDAGDELLRQVAKLFSEHLRKGDTLGRIGGDEFGVLLKYCTFDQANRVMQSLRNSTQSLPFFWQSQKFSIDVSIGMAVVNDEVRSATVALKNADSACYAAKKSGRSGIHAFIGSGNESAARVIMYDRL